MLGVSSALGATVNRIEIIVWTTWVPNEDELKELRKTVAKAVPQDQKVWVETEGK